MEQAAARIQRNLSPWELFSKSVRALPSVLTCSRRFRNWKELTRLYRGKDPLNPPFVAEGRKDFSITHWELSDVQSTWRVVCAPTYRVPTSSRLVLDLGANIGVFSIYAARVRNAAAVIALEPVAGTFERLQSNIKANGLESTVKTIRKGIGGTTGTRTIHLGSSSPHSSMYYRGDPTYESGTTEQIEVITLDQLFADERVDQVDMCKMDCEGGEVEAILAASDQTLRRMASISMEYHFPGNVSDKATFFGRLEKAGFRCRWHARDAMEAWWVRDGKP